MKLLNGLIVFFVCISLGHASPKLDHLWVQVKKMVERRKEGIIADHAFIEWYMFNIRRVLSRQEMRIAILGLPDVIVSKDGDKLSSQAINGKWRDSLSKQWGKYGNEVYSFWSDRNVEDLRLASKKECILFAEILSFQPRTGVKWEGDIEICDSPIRATPRFWALIYGKEVLSYPSSANLQPLFYDYVPCK